MDKDLAGQVADIAQRVVASGAISANGHGNVSVRVPGAREMYVTAGPSLRSHPVPAVMGVGLGPAVLHPPEPGGHWVVVYCGRIATAMRSAASGGGPWGMP
jgi:hypothetical protein